jgi:phosphoribosylanthranilate isomerase
VKICGMTRLEDVALAVDAGAEAVGLVCHAASPRNVTAEEARVLTGAVPRGVSAIAVFVDRAPDEVLEWARTARASAVQLCGAEDPEEWVGFELPILRRLAVGDGARTELARWRPIASGFVLDHASEPGGSGRNVDPGLAGELARSAPCLLAGGLDAENVALAIERVRPLGVDASSRLESAPGRKDPERVRAFLARALEALALTARDGAPRRAGDEG